MTQQTAPPEGLTPEDEEHLRLLRIAYLAVGALTALCGLFPMIHVGVGVGLASGVFDADPEARLVGVLFMVIGLLVIVFFWTLAVAMFMAAGRLRSCRGYTLCLVVAAVSCAFAPIGTVLGVLTIIVLMRPSVKAAFGKL
jgi:hypothetical protein